MIGLGLRVNCLCTKLYVHLAQQPGLRRPVFKTNSISLHHGQRMYSFKTAPVKVVKLPNLHTLVLIRRIASDSRSKFDSAKTILSYRMKDGIPKTYEMIYRSTFGNYILSVQVFQFLLLGAMITVAAFKGFQIMFPPSEEQIQEVLKQMKELQYIKDTATEEELKKNLRNPRFEEIAEGGWPVIVCFLVVSVFFLGTLVRFQRNLPIRMYTGPKGHTIAVFYGHFLPLRTTRYEFLAGTLKLTSNPKESFWKLGLYKDDNGKELILMEHFFRYPADLNKLCGDHKDSTDSDWRDDEDRTTDRGPIPHDSNFSDESSLKIRPTPLKSTKPKPEGEK